MTELNNEKLNPAETPLPGAEGWVDPSEDRPGANRGNGAGWDSDLWNNPPHEGWGPQKTN